MTKGRNKPSSTKPTKPTKSRGPRPAPDRPHASRRDWPLWLAGILLVTFFVYVPCLDNDFTNWDDNFYVTDNPMMMNPTMDTVLRTPVAGNYHPLTMWSLVLNYKAAGLDPAPYHWTSLLLHLANTALVFFFVRALSRGRRWTAIVSAALFGIHPMHVESVAWVAERKDVLYTFFYLAGLIAYLAYVDRRKRVWLGVALVAFVLSAASKPAAVVFPITLLAIDWFRNRRFTRGVWLEKAPFFLVSLIDGILTLQVQQMSGAITQHWNQLERVAFAAYGTVMYIVKMFVPIGLSAVYPYPALGAPSIGAQYYLALAAALILFPALIWIFRKNRVVLFGLAFYVINIILVLQFFTVGGSVMADRYTYVAYIGLFVALAWWLDEPRERLPRGVPVRTAIAVVILVLLPVSAYATWRRCDVWQDPETLWNDTIAKYPRRIADAYNNRGFYFFMHEQRYEDALADFDQAIALNRSTPKFWANKGMVLGSMNRNDSALVAFDRAIALLPNSPDYWNNRGAVKLQLKNYEGTVADCSRAIALNPRQRDAYSNREVAYLNLGRFEEAIADSRKAIELDSRNPSNYVHYGTIGFARSGQKRYPEAIAAFDEAIRLGPPGDLRVASYYLYRSLARSETGDKAGAQSDAQEAQRRGVRLESANLKKAGG
jgi:tetratricopeptide (TPR) repeat protein